MKFAAAVVLCLAAVVHLNSAALSPGCAAIVPKERQECGWPGISQATCTGRGCCFDDTIWGVRWCFKPPGGRTVNVDGNQVIDELYVDGRAITPLPNGGTSGTFDPVDLPLNECVVAFKITNPSSVSSLTVYGQPGIVEDSTWRCTTNPGDLTNWYQPYFDDSSWPAATTTFSSVSGGSQINVQTSAGSSGAIYCRGIFHDWTTSTTVTTTKMTTTTAAPTTTTTTAAPTTTTAAPTTTTVGYGYNIYLPPANTTDRGCECITPSDCGDILALGNTVSGVYTIYVGSSLRPVRVWCDMTTDGGGWTVIQRRKDGSVSFDRTFAEYEDGFGDPAAEHWMGLKYLRSLLASQQYRLRFELTNFKTPAVSAWVEYSKFLIAGSSLQYQLISIGDYVKTPNVNDDLNSFDVSLWNKFYAKDNDNGLNCASTRGGGWWYVGCGESALNSKYLQGTSPTIYSGIMWWPWTGGYDTLKSTEMKVRRNDI